MYLQNSYKIYIVTGSMVVYLDILCNSHTVIKEYDKILLKY